MMLIEDRIAQESGFKSWEELVKKVKRLKKQGVSIKIPLYVKSSFFEIILQNLKVLLDKDGLKAYVNDDAVILYKDKK